MSTVIRLNLNPENRLLRQFGWVALIGFGALATLAFTERLLFSFGLGTARVPVAATLFALGIVSALLGVIAPRANKPLFVGLSLISYPIGFVMSYVIMGTLYFAVFAPLAMAFRAAGRDVLTRKYDPEAPSYWSPARSARPNSSYFRQF